MQSKPFFCVYVQQYRKKNFARTMRKCARCEEVSRLGRDYCGYPVLYFHFAYNSCVEFRTRGLCKRSGW